MPEHRSSLAGYRLALEFIVPYWPRLVIVLLVGIASTSLSLIQPYISKLLIDDALLKRDLRMLGIISAVMFGVTMARLLAEHRLQLSIRARLRERSVRYASGALAAPAIALAALLGPRQDG